MTYIYQNLTRNTYLDDIFIYIYIYIYLEEVKTEKYDMNAF